MFKIMIDPGHGPGNKNVGLNGYYEYKAMWKLSNYLAESLRDLGYCVDLTRGENVDTPLKMRGQLAAGYDLFISEHSNAANGIAKGVECFYSVDIPSDLEIAKDFSKTVSEVMNTTNRGAKIRESSTKGEDYYTVIDSAQDYGCKHVFLIENGFHDNLDDIQSLDCDGGLKEIALVQEGVILKNFPLYNLSKDEILVQKLKQIGVNFDINIWEEAILENLELANKKYYAILLNSVLALESSNINTIQHFKKILFEIFKIH